MYTSLWLCASGNVCVYNLMPLPALALSQFHNSLSTKAYQHILLEVGRRNKISENNDHRMTMMTTPSISTSEIKNIIAILRMNSNSTLRFCNGNERNIGKILIYHFLSSWGWGLGERVCNGEDELFQSLSSLQGICLRPRTLNNGRIALINCASNNYISQCLSAFFKCWR